MRSRHNRHTVCPPKRRENMQNNEHKVTREFSRLSRRDIQYTGGLVCQRREPFRIVYSGANTQYSHFRTSPESKMEVVKETLNVAGLLTNVYAHRDLHTKLSSEPIVVLFFPWFFLHGRGSSAEAVDPTPRAAFAWVAEKQASSKQSPPGLHSGYVCTLVWFPMLAVRDGSQADSWVSTMAVWLTSGLAGPAEPWQENSGWTRELGMEL